MNIGRTIAICLAVAAAITAPFAFGTSRPQANARSWIPLTPEQRMEIVAKLENSKNCRYFETQIEARDVLGLTVDPKDIDDALRCHRDQDALRDGAKCGLISRCRAISPSTPGLLWRAHSPYSDLR